MSGNFYVLYVKLRAGWEQVCRIEADSHADALRVAAACLRPEHDDKPIRLEQQAPEPDAAHVH